MMQNPILVFDIETIPDTATGKRLYPELADLPDDQATERLIALREAQTEGNPFMPLAMHQVACLSVLWVAGGKMTLKSLSLNTHSEAEILQTFFNAMDKLPTLVSWNGKGFDIPVMTYRALQQGLSAPKLFAQTGEMKYNNYTNRYHDRHTDLMVKLAMGSTPQKLDIVASVCGFAGKGDTDGYDVVPMVQAGEWDKLTTYCESDVLNTWLLYLRYQRLVGALTPDQAEQWEQQTRTYLHSLTQADGTHRHDKFLQGWQPITPTGNEPLPQTPASASDSEAVLPSQTDDPVATVSPADTATNP